MVDCYRPVIVDTILMSLSAVFLGNPVSTCHNPIPMLLHLVSGHVQWFIAILCEGTFSINVDSLRRELGHVRESSVLYEDLQQVQHVE